MHKIILVNNIEEALELLRNADGVEVQVGDERAPIDKELAVDDKLRFMGVPASILGHGYLKKAVLMVWDDPALVQQVTKVLYPDIAKQVGSTPQRVERAIRHAVELAWDRGDLDAQFSLFGYTVSKDRGRPTNSEFIATIANRLRMENK